MMARMLAIGFGAVAIIAAGVYFCQCFLRRRAQREGEDNAEPAEFTHEELPDENSALLPINQKLKRFQLGQPTKRKPAKSAKSVSEPASSSTAVGDTVQRKEDVPEIPQGCQLSLETISGPVSGKSISKLALAPPWPSITIGRVPQNEFALNDQEVSSRHALVLWNAKVGRWQVVDKGSLNGTLLNSQPIGADQSSGERVDGKAMDLVDGDIVTVGSSSRLLVRISGKPPVPEPDPAPIEAPFAVAILADPMTARKGGKPLPMEDVPLVEWPLRGLKDFGLFCVFDGHAGRAAAENAKRIMPEKLSAILLANNTHESVRAEGNATDVLTEAFHQTEADLPNEDEGCTATVLLVWRDKHNMLVAQAANVGDSHCVFSIGGQQIVLTEDHRLTGPVERARLEALGKGLREGESRLCGMNIARVLGDKFLKHQGVGLSAEPYVSQVMTLGDGFDAVAVIASDGLWDVMSPKRAVQLLLEAKETAGTENGEEAMPAVEAMAQKLVHRAKLGRTQDNTTVVVLDFGTKASL